MRSLKIVRSLIAIPLVFGIIASLVFMPGLAYSASLPARTIVVLSVGEEIVGGELAEGTEVMLKVARDVTVGGKVLIKAGAPASMMLETSQARAIIGAPSKIVLKARSVQAVDGQTVYLRGSVAKEGKDNMVTSIAIGAIGTAFLCPVGFLMRGGSEPITAGTEIKTYVENDMNIK